MKLDNLPAALEKNICEEDDENKKDNYWDISNFHNDRVHWLSTRSGKGLFGEYS